MDYDEMLDRGLEETPDIVGDSARFEVPDADVRQEGHVTVFENSRRVPLQPAAGRAPGHRDARLRGAQRPVPAGGDRW